MPDKHSCGKNDSTKVVETSEVHKNKVRGEAEAAATKDSNLKADGARLKFINKSCPDDCPKKEKLDDGATLIEVHSVLKDGKWESTAKSEWFAIVECKKQKEKTNKKR